jgi:hypothetical protein
MADDALTEKVARAICSAAGYDPDEGVATGRKIGRRDRNRMWQEDEKIPRWRQFEAEAVKHIAAWRVLSAV